MTPEEFPKLVDALVHCYPNLQAWLADNFPDVAKTLRNWRDALAKYSLDECFTVLSMWNEKAEFPWPGNIATRMVQDLDWRREELQRKRKRHQQQIELSLRMARFDQCRETPIDAGMTEALVKARRCREMRDRGELDSQDANRIIHGILQSVR